MYGAAALIVILQSLNPLSSSNAAHVLFAQKFSSREIYVISGEEVWGGYLAYYPPLSSATWKVYGDLLKCFPLLWEKCVFNKFVAQYNIYTYNIEP